MKTYEPHFKAFLNFKPFIIYIVIIEIIYRVFVYPYLNEYFSNLTYIWIFGPNVIVIPISFFKYHFWLQRGGFDFMNVTVSEDSVEGLSSLKSLRETVPLAHRLIKDVTSFHYGPETRKAVNPRETIKIKDIDWNGSFKTEFFLWPRAKLGIYKKIYSLKGKSILLHWLLGDEQINDLKNTLQRMSQQ